MKLKYNSYNDLTIDVFYKLNEALKEEDGLERQIKVVSILSDIPENELLKKDLSVFNEFSNQLLWLQEKPNVPTVNKNYRINIEGFGECKICELTKFNISQYIDFQNFYNTSENNPEQLISTFLVPINKEYGDDYDVFAYQNAIRNNMNILEARSLCFFILQKFHRSINNTLTYSILMMKMRLLITWNKMKRQAIKEQIQIMKTQKELLKIQLNSISILCA